MFADYQETGLSRISGEGGIVARLTGVDPKRGAASHRLLFLGSRTRKPSYSPS